MRSPLEPGERRPGLARTGARRSSSSTIRGEDDKADEKVQPVLDAVDRVQARHPDFTVAEFGFASSTTS